MIVALLTGEKARLDLKESSAEIDDWAAEKPLNGSIVFSTETKSFWRYNESEGGAINVGTPIFAKPIDYYVTLGDTSIPANAALENRTILSFQRDGIGKAVVLGTPSNINQIGYNHIDGSFLLFTGEEFGDEWIHIIYSIEPTAV